MNFIYILVLGLMIKSVGCNELKNTSNNDKPMVEDVEDCTSCAEGIYNPQLFNPTPPIILPPDGTVPPPPKPMCTQDLILWQKAILCACRDAAQLGDQAPSYALEICNNGLTHDTQFNAHDQLCVFDDKSQVCPWECKSLINQCLQAK